MQQQAKFSRSTWSIFFLFLAHQFLQKVLQVALPFIDAYFDPFACAVLGLAAIKFERAWIWKQKDFRFEWYELLGVIVFLAFVSEYIFPLFSNDFTSDVYDIFAIVAGGIHFHLTENQTIKNNAIKTEQ